MEDVLDVYVRPYDPDYPVVCLDETNKQLVKETRIPLPIKPGHPQYYDYEYERNGVCNLLMLSEPLAGWRHVKVTDRRTKKDYAQILKYLVDERYPHSQMITVIQDNLNTHVKNAVYEAFPPQEAKRLLDKLEFHYTPKHGSWLNIAEIELSVLCGQCLDQRLPDQQSLKQVLAAWEAERNAKGTKVNWRFTTQDARIKLKRLYPSLED
jgi:hypothetical protein